jgi:cell division protease FtsH
MRIQESMFKELLLRYKKPFGAIAVTTVALLLMGVYIALRDTSSVIGYEKLNTLVTQKQVKKAVLSSQYIYLYTNNAVYSVPKTDKNEELVVNHIPIEHSFQFLPFLLFASVSLGMFVLIWKITSTYLNKKSSYGIIKASASKGNDDTPKEQIYEIKSPLKFSDIAGVNEAKEELEEIVKFLKNPKIFKSKNISMPKGVLLVGSPGVGKTLLARAVAGEAGVPFFYKSAATFVELYVGVGAKRVNELFLAAKRKSPSIIFIDEIDAIGKKRGGASAGERESTLNQLLVEMDGFESSSGVIVIAATNKMEILDDALLRAGRFDRRVFVDLPDAHGREEILHIYLKNKKHQCDVAQIAKRTAGFSGAALANLVNEAAINSLRKGTEIITDADFDAVRNKVAYGKKRINILGQKELEILSVYQAAKLFFAIKNGIPVAYASQTEIRIDDDAMDFKSGEEIKNLASFYLSGRAATLAFFGKTFYQSANDYEKANSIIKEYILKYRLLRTDLSDEKKIADAIEDELASWSVQNKELILKVAEAFMEDKHFSEAEISNIAVF